MDSHKLMEIAIKARENAYVPYSNYKVGAALLTKEGTVFTGCNIENAAYSPTNCAERTAFFKAVSEGAREFKAIAIAGGKEELAPCTPCGVCRQVMAEFCNPEQFQIIVLNNQGQEEIYLLKQLLPNSFGPASLVEKITC